MIREDSLEMHREHERHDGDPETDHASVGDVTATRPSPVILRRRPASDPGDDDEGDPIPTVAVPVGARPSPRRTGQRSQGD
jgi:hypothetical protein